MKKNLTEEWQKIKEVKEELSHDFSNPLGDFIKSLPKKKQDQFMNMFFPRWKENELFNQISFCFKKYRNVRKNYFLDQNNEFAKGQLFAMDLYKESIKKNIQKLRNLKSNKKTQA